MSSLRLLALLVIRQAFVDAVSDDESLAAESRRFLMHDGKLILAALGLRPGLIDEYLANPASFGSLRVEVADGRDSRRGG